MTLAQKKSWTSWGQPMAHGNCPEKLFASRPLASVPVLTNSFSLFFTSPTRRLTHVGGLSRQNRKMVGMH